MNPNVKLGNVTVSLIGKFQLEVRKPAKKFALTNIDSYVPQGKKVEDKVKFLTQDGEVETLLIDKLKTNYYPDKSEIDKENVRRMIGHPAVFLDGYPEEVWNELIRKNIKSPKSDFILRNLEKIDDNKFEEKTKLIEAQAILYGTLQPISVEKLKWMCSTFGLTYRQQTSDMNRYRVQLVNSLDAFIQNTKAKTNNKTNLERFIDAIKNIEETEVRYYINELISLGMIKDYGGMYKVGDRPVGRNINDIIKYYREQPEVYISHKKEVLEASQMTP